MQRAARSDPSGPLYFHAGAETPDINKVNKDARLKYPAPTLGARPVRKRRRLRQLRSATAPETRQPAPDLLRRNLPVGRSQIKKFRHLGLQFQQPAKAKMPTLGRPLTAFWRRLGSGSRRQCRCRPMTATAAGGSAWPSAPSSVPAGRPSTRRTGSRGDERAQSNSVRDAQRLEGRRFHAAGDERQTHQDCLDRSSGANAKSDGVALTKRQQHDQIRARDATSPAGETRMTGLVLFARQHWPAWYAWGDEVGKYSRLATTRRRSRMGGAFLSARS
jgi:hypothetical protein